MAILHANNRFARAEGMERREGVRQMITNGLAVEVFT